MSNEKDVFFNLLYSVLARKLFDDVKHVSDEFSTEANQVVAEFERLNLMNAIDKCLINGDKEAFMQLTGELNKVGEASESRT